MVIHIPKQRNFTQKLSTIHLIASNDKNKAQYVHFVDTIKNYTAAFCVSRYKVALWMAYLNTSLLLFDLSKSNFVGTLFET